MFFRLCWRAPRTTSLVNGMGSLAVAAPRAVLLGAAAHSGPDEAKLTSHNSRWDSGRSNRGDFPATNRICGAHRSRAQLRALTAQRESTGSGKRNQQLDVKLASAGSLRVERIPILGIAADCKLRANSHFST